MKYTSFLLILTLFACSRNEPAEVSLYKDLVHFIDNQNKNLFINMHKAVKEEGEHPDDIKVLSTPNRVYAIRNNIKMNNSGLRQFKETLTHEYRELSLADSSRIKRSDLLEEKYVKEGDSTAFYKYILSLLTMEYEVYNYYAMRLQSCRWLSSFANISKSHDSIPLNKKYSVAVIPFQFSPVNVQTVLGSDLRILHNNAPSNLEVESEVFGGTVLLKMHPKKRGKYEIRGSILCEDSNFGLKQTVSFTDAFYVK